MNIAGLTGGIASGKSTVCDFFKDVGAVIIDADKIAHKAVKKNQPAWKKIVQYFGKNVLLPDGEINREYLGNIVFNNTDAKNQLNSIVHPFVFQEIKNQIKIIQRHNLEALIIQDIPLLMESGMYKNVSPVILVYIPKDLQLKRLMKRNNLSKQDALARINSQMPIEEKKKLADIIIDNSGSLQNTKKQILSIYNKLLNFNP